MTRRLSPLVFAACSLLFACESKPKPEPAAAPAPTPEATTPPAKPTLPPTLIVDAQGALVAGARVSLDARDAKQRLESELSPHRSFIEKKEVRVAAERPAKPASVALLLEALRTLGASRVLVRTSSRADFPNEVGFIALSQARSAPSCSVVAMITEDRGTAVWSLAGGTAGKRGKGMAGPDLTLTGETITARAKSCSDSQVLFVAGALGVEWGLVYDLAASTKTLPKAFFSDTAVLGDPPVPGHKVKLDG